MKRQRKKCYSQTNLVEVIQRKKKELKKIQTFGPLEMSLKILKGTKIKITIENKENGSHIMSLLTI